MTFGSDLRRRRTERRLSQHDLTALTGVSQRHLSCLERGKAQPSRGMVVHLGRALELPPAALNDLLLAAGFAPAFAVERPDDPALRAARDAATFILERHEPCPAIALDGQWKVVDTNGSFRSLAGFLAEGDPSAMPSLVGGDYLASLGRSTGICAFMTNRESIACNTLERVVRDATLRGNEALRDRALALLSAFDREAVHEAACDPGPLPVVELRRGQVSLRFITIMVSFATPCARVLDSLRIEVFHPQDDATRAHLEAWRALSAEPSPLPAAAARSPSHRPGPHLPQKQLADASQSAPVEQP